MPASSMFRSKREFEGGVAEKNNKYMAKYYKKLQEEHGGKVVAVSNGKFLCSAETTEEVLQKLSVDKVDLDTVLVEYVPEPGVVILF